MNPERFSLERKEVEKLLRKKHLWNTKNNKEEKVKSPLDPTLKQKHKNPLLDKSTKQ